MAMEPYAVVTLSLDGQEIKTDAAALLVSGTEGVYLCEFDPDEIWEGFDGKMTAVFDPAIGQRKEVPVINYQAEIPPEVLRGPWIQIGVYAKDGAMTYPTVFSTRLPIKRGASVI